MAGYHLRIPAVCAARRAAAHLMAAVVLAGGVAGTAKAGPDVDLSGLGGGPGGSRAPIDITADSVEYQKRGDIIHATGNVRIWRTNELLQANEVTLDTKTSTVRARGNVLFQRDKKVWRGSEFTYNLTNRMWTTGAFASFLPPFKITAKRSESAIVPPEPDSTSRVARIEYILHDAMLTTCTNDADHYHYSMKAREARIIPGKQAVMRGLVVSMGGVPVLYTPYWYRNLEDPTLGLVLRVGYRSHWGGYLLTGYRYRLNDYFKMTTFVETRTKRGFGLGQDLTWQRTTAASNSIKGAIEANWLDDSDIEEDHTATEYAKIKSSRFRIRAHHSQTLTERAYMLADFTYFGDPYFLEDFFEDEYQNSSQPENYISVNHRGNNYSVGIFARIRLNDYYNAVNRLPEVNYDVSRMQIESTPFYYESHSTLSYLQKVWEAANTNDEYSAARLDSSHYIYYPTRHFSFLNIIPRVGYRGTWYSDSVENRIEQATVSTVLTNVSGSSTALVASAFRTVTVTNKYEAGSAFRSLLELGCEVSFKAYGTWNDLKSLPLIDGLRHIVEPYANYTFSPVPTVDAQDLYHFDNVDSLGEVNTLKTGVRNLLQTKRKKGTFELFNSDIYAYWNMAPEEDQDAFSRAGTKTTLHLNDKFKVEFTGTYSNNIMSETGTRLWLVYPKFKTSFEYRENKDTGSRLYTPMINILPNKYWTFEAYMRYEARDSRIEEHVYNIQREYDCMAWRLGFKHVPAYTRSDGFERDDDYRVEFTLWTLAFPSSKFGSLHEYKVQME